MFFGVIGSFIFLSGQGFWPPPPPLADMSPNKVNVSWRLPWGSGQFKKKYGKKEKNLRGVYPKIYLENQLLHTKLYDITILIKFILNLDLTSFEEKK